jgi:Tfp pilus assembly protein PilV
MNRLTPMSRLTPKMRQGIRRGRRAERGTSLLELMVAVAVFMIIAGSVFKLFQQQQGSQATLSGQVGINLALRATVAQLQMDVINAGNGYYQNANIPSWPVGVTIVNTLNNSGTACNSGTTYGPSCFDQLNVLVAANSSTYPPVQPAASVNTSTGSMTVLPASGFTAAQTEAEFVKGDELLVISNSGTPQIAAVVLTGNGTLSGSNVLLTFNPTDANGLNTVNQATPADTDWLDISACDNPASGISAAACNTALNNSTPARFTDAFSTAAWIIKLAPVSYQVCAGPGSSTSPYSCDQSAGSPDIADPKLIRTQAGVSTMMMDQIIGFRVGAYLFNSPNSGCQYESNDVLCNYQYVAANYTVSNGTTASDPYNFSLVRGVRVSLIGRTAPNYRTSYRNSFDGGPYQVQGTAAVINPRNMSMNDNGGLP